MTVFVIYDRLHEQVISVHKTAIGADKRIVKICETSNEIADPNDYEFDEYEVED